MQRSCSGKRLLVSEHRESTAKTPYKYTPNTALKHLFLFITLFLNKQHFCMSSEYSTSNYNKEDKKKNL